MGLDVEEASKVFNIEWLKKHAHQKEDLKIGSMVRDAPPKDEK